MSKNQPTSTTAEPRISTAIPTAAGPVEPVTKPRAESAMVEGLWGDQKHWRCAKCGQDTFKEEVAKAHRC